MGKQIHLSIVAQQGALHTLHHLGIPFGTLSNFALYISWAYVHLSKIISEIRLGVKYIGIIYFIQNFLTA
uniref:Uncharacterized protein n=1 Tax=bacterium enrichment culture clone fosmid MGS-K1 TaxID=1549356 RepID=A0A0B5KC45_9BACT|nr:hypothetical protein [bacterium enrichment culture clone fosmid MGS-K1]